MSKLDLSEEKIRLKEFLSSYKDVSSDQILDYVTSISYASESANNDLYILSKYLKTDDIRNLVFNLSGKKIQLPTIEEYYKSYIVSICFYLIEIKGMKWDEVKERLQSENSFIFDKYVTVMDVGRRISKIKKYIKSQLNEILKNKMR